MTSPYGGPAGAPDVPPQPQYQPGSPSAVPAQPYPPAQHPTAQYPPTQYPAAPYATGQYPAAQYPAAQYPATQHAGPYPTSPGPSVPLAYKDPTAAWLLWFFLGFLGAHHFFLGRTQRGTVYAVTWVLSLLLSFVVVGFLGFAVLLVLWIVDATQLNQRLAAYNAHAFATNRSLGLA